MIPGVRCWCGGTRLAGFNDGYMDCLDCGSLIVRRSPAWMDGAGENAARRYYETRYWDQVREQADRPGLEQRARDDLTDRCPHWLEIVLRFRPPPARVLEVGCFHGGFVALLHAAGYHAAGLEPDAAAAAFGRREFQVDIEQEMLESTRTAPGSQDLAVALDVLEHLADPLVGMERLAGLVDAGGSLLVQTPCRPVDRDFSDLVRSEHPFVNMLLPEEHLVLFSSDAVTLLLGRFGFDYLSFEPAVFPGQDMLVVAGRKTLTPDRGAVAVPRRGRESRLLAAMLSLYHGAASGRDAGGASSGRPDADDKPVETVRWQLPVGTTRPRPARPGCIAIDLTSMEPGGINGGTGVVCLELTRALTGAFPGRRFLLLLRESAPLPAGLPDGGNITLARLDRAGIQLVPLFSKHRVTVLFVPAFSGIKTDPRIPTVFLVQDLLHRDRPGFLDEAENLRRQEYFEQVVDRAAAVVVPTGFTRDSVRAHLDFEPQRIAVIPYEISRRLLPEPGPGPGDGGAGDELEREGYLLYPANFWPHKNHANLLLGFREFLDGDPGSPIRLLLTGTGHPGRQEVELLVRRLELEDHVVLAGYVPDEQLARLLRNCLALVFPSMYEGFGLPVLEAMACARPVLCSDAGSLPEVVANGAVLFDPSDPTAIASCIREVRDGSRRIRDTVAAGNLRASTFADPARMAGRYMRVFETAQQSPAVFYDDLAGVYADGWTGREFVAGFGPSGHDRSRHMEMSFDTAVLPYQSPVLLEVLTSGGESRELELRRDASTRLDIALPAGGGCLEFSVHKVFIPSRIANSSDDRELGVRLSRCLILENGVLSRQLFPRRQAPTGVVR